MAGSIESPSMGDSSTGKGLLHASIEQISVKLFIAVMGSGYVKPYPISQGRPEIKFLFQEGVSGKESLMPMPPDL